MELSHQTRMDLEERSAPAASAVVLCDHQQPEDSTEEVLNIMVNDEELDDRLNEPISTSLDLQEIAAMDHPINTLPPEDKYNLIYLVLLLHGLGTLTAWNMFITAKDYFVKYKLANAPEYGADFMTNVGWASQVPNLIFSWYNIFGKVDAGNLTTRILLSLCAELVIFVLTIVLAVMDSSEWPVVFFWITMVSVFFLNGFNAIFQNSVYGMAAQFPPQYTGAVVLGSNVCGTIVVLLNWISDEFTTNYKTSAIYYFIAGTLVLAVCLETYFVLPLNRFFRYHEALHHHNTLRDIRLSNMNVDSSVSQPIPYRFIIKQSCGQLYNIFITFFVTLAVFPAIHSDIEAITPGFLGVNFSRFTCFLTFSITAMLGNVTASVWHYPRPKWLWVFTTLRVLFIPLFMLCNYHPMGRTRTLPVFINNDWVYWTMSAIFGWSSGHGSTLGMIYVGGTVMADYTLTASMIGGATLVLGIFMGITFSKFAPILVSLAAWNTTLQ